jgi:hypothetical protein
MLPRDQPHHDEETEYFTNQKTLLLKIYGAGWKIIREKVFHCATHENEKYYAADGRSGAGEY